MKQILQILMLVFAVTVAVHAAEPLTLEALVKHIVTESYDYTDAKLSLSKAKANYDQNMANLFPAFTATIPGSLGYAPTYSPMAGLTLHDSFSLGLSPELRVSQYLPTSGTLSLSLSDAFSSASASSIETTYANKVSLGLSLVQPLFFENAYQAALVTTEETYNAAKLASVSRINRLVYQAAADYFRLKLSGYALSLAATRLADTRQNYEDSKRKYEQGVLSRLAFINVETALKKAELDMLDSELAHEQSLAAFASAYGFDEIPVVDNAVAEVSPVRTPGTVDALFEVASERNVELAMERKALLVADALLVTTKFANAPFTLSAGPSVTFDKKGADSTNLADAFGGPFGADANTTFSMGVSLSCSLFDAGLKQNKILAQEVETEQKRFAFESKLKKARNDAAALFMKMERNRKSLEYADLAMQVAELEYETAKADYAAGGISRLEFSSESIKRDDASLRHMQASVDAALFALELSLFMGDDLVTVITRSKT